MHMWALGLSCETPAAPPDRAAGARTRQPENTKRAHLRVPAFTKHHQNSTRRHPEREEKNEFCGGRGKKRAKFWVVQGKGGPGEGRSRGRAVQGKGGPNQTLKHTTQHNTTQHNTTQHNTTQHNTHTTNQTRFGQSRFWPKSVWPKSVLAKVGFGQSRFWPKSIWAKVGFDQSRPYH